MVSRRLLSLVLLFSVLVVWSHWNLFSIGVIALGFNFSLFWAGFALIIYLLDNSYSIKRDWAWLAPIVLIALSFSLYENPWLKLVSLLLLPIIVGVFCAYSHFNNRDGLLWNRALLQTIGVRLFKPLHATGHAFEGMFEQPSLASSEAYAGLIARVLAGIAILLPLSLLVIALLSSADPKFGELVLNHARFLLGGVSWLLLWKLLLALLLAIALLSIAVGWSGPIEYHASSATKPVDGLVAGIVLGGLLLIYMAFLYLQFDHLVVDELPESFREAELMVKSGFWQLFVLAVLNTGLFFIVYRKTGPITQGVLRVFIVASSLLMVSAAWKVWLYSYTFGLSYEKFFACYTAVFALGVLLYLVVANFSTHRRNVVKRIAFAALWGYGLATVCPIEKIIFHGNLYFSEQGNTRIALYQLSQLSLDVLSDVDAVYDSRLAVDANAIAVWRRWQANQANVFCNRAWYEANLSAVAACR